MTDNQTWMRCHKGSCHRHEECMYAPCRAGPPLAVGDTVMIGNTEWTVGATLIAPRPPHDTLGDSDGDDGA